jgi:hypothetical protein
MTSFGEKAVGLDFNPSGSTSVQGIKVAFANVIDVLNELRNQSGVTSEQVRLYSIAITEAQAAQMWAVKAATWR